MLYSTSATQASPSTPWVHNQTNAKDGATTRPGSEYSRNRRALAVSLANHVHSASAGQ